MLATNPDIRILHHEGRLFASPLSGATQAVPIAEPDLVLLAVFLAGSVRANIVASLQSTGYARYIPGVPPQNILERINQLRQAQVLVDVPSALPVNETAMILADCPDGSGLPQNLPLRLGNNFSLELVPGGFRIWSAGAGESFLLSLELTLLLVSFATGKPAAQVVQQAGRIGDPTARKRGILWLKSSRLLVEKKIAAQPKDGQGSSASVHNFTPGKMSYHETTAPGWKDLVPDNRIPVYFVPHMLNHFPLALGMISSYLKTYKEGELLKKCQLIPISYMTPNEFIQGPYEKFGVGVWMFSNYLWSLSVNLEVCEAVKKHNPANITIHGGPSTPSYEQSCADFMTENPTVNIAVHGEGEITAAEILDNLFYSILGTIEFDPDSMREVNGLTFRDPTPDRALVRTSPRSRMTDLDVIESPYLNGAFDAYGGDVDAAIIESNRGCPFGCTFCDWGSATNQKVRKFDLGKVKQEIDWIGSNKVKILWIADANYGMYDRDIELAQWICDTKAKYGYPSEVVVNYTKNATRRLAEIVKIFTANSIISQGIISIQTTDENTLNIINRRNIKTEKYDELTRIFADEHLPLSTDLMIGLPGITREAFNNDLQRYFDKDITAKAYRTQLLPNSPMADPEYLEKYQIKVDEEDYLVSCYSYNEEDLRSMVASHYMYEIADCYSVLRYVLRFLQWEHEIPAMGFLHRMLDQVEQDPAHYPAITWVTRSFLKTKCMPGGWRSFYEEIGRFAGDAFGVELDSAFQTVLRVNELVMPDDTVSYPANLEIEHDLVSYFIDHNARQVKSVKPLRDYPPGSITVDDPSSLAEIDHNFEPYDTHSYYWELHSEIARFQSSPSAL